VASDAIQDIEELAPGSRDRRLKILGPAEIKELFCLPHFPDEEREQLFAVTPTEKAALDDLHSVKSKIAFILQLGYFKARRMFFVFSENEVIARCEIRRGAIFSRYCYTRLHGDEGHSPETSIFNPGIMQI
jgi:hypothetical protein